MVVAGFFLGSISAPGQLHIGGDLTAILPICLIPL